MNLPLFALEAFQVLGMMILASGLLGRNLVLRRDITPHDARNVRRLDVYAWSGAAIAGVSHGAIVISDVAGRELHMLLNRFEWLEIGLFSLLLALQIFPARVFHSWHRYVVRDQIPWYTDRQHDTLVWIGRVQIVLVMLLPVLPPFISRGIGLPR
jgi:uncharacterized membrane protein